MSQNSIIITYFKLSEKERRSRFLAGNSAELLQQRTFAIGDAHIVVLNDNGTVNAYGDNVNGQCDVGNWKMIKKVAAGDSHSVGLKIDGSVVATGDNSRGQCNVSEWRNIVDVFAQNHMTVGVTADGRIQVTSPARETPVPHSANHLQEKKAAESNPADQRSVPMIEKRLNNVFDYSKLSGSYRVDSYIGKSDLVKIPFGVKEIADKAFFGNKKVYRIEIPESVTKIGAQAFRNCPRLYSITIPPSVTVIRPDAFDDTTRVLCLKNTYAEQYAKQHLKNYVIF